MTSRPIGSYALDLVGDTVVSGEDWADEQPVRLGVAVPDSDAVPAPPTAQRLAVVGAPRALPKGWPRKSTQPVWNWLAQRRSPIAVVFAAAAGGVGTSATAAVVAETLAAASPGPTVLLDQSGSPWGDVTRRALGQRTGLPARSAMTHLEQGHPPSRILQSAPTTAAGAMVLLDDAEASCPLRDLRILVAAACGALVVDGGRVDPWLLQRLDLHVVRPILVLVGRADLAGAETTCAALSWLRRSAPIAPVVVLSCTTPTDKKRVASATRLVATVTPNVTHLPFDHQLSHGQPVRLDTVHANTAQAVAEIVTAIRHAQEGHDSVGSSGQSPR